MEELKMKAIVIGGGIGGMSAAIALEKAGITTEVYEAAQQMKPVAAAISIWPNGERLVKFFTL